MIAGIGIERSQKKAAFRSFRPTYESGIPVRHTVAPRGKGAGLIMKLHPSGDQLLGAPHRTEAAVKRGIHHREPGTKILHGIEDRIWSAAVKRLRGACPDGARGSDARAENVSQGRFKPRPLRYGSTNRCIGGIRWLRDISHG